MSDDTREQVLGAVHHYLDGTSDAFCGGMFGHGTADADKVTCKRCVELLALRVELNLRGRRTHLGLSYGAIACGRDDAYGPQEYLTQDPKQVNCAYCRVIMAGDPAPELGE